MPIQVTPEMWESAMMIMLGKYKNGEIWSEGSGTTPCPSTCLTDKYKVTDGHLTPADNQFVALNPQHKYAIVPAKGDRTVVTYVPLKPEHHRSMSLHTSMRCSPSMTSLSRLLRFQHANDW